MPPKKKSGNKTEGLKKGKIVLKSTLSTLQKNALSKLQQKININGFRWQLVNGLFVQCDVRSILQATQQLNINHLGLANNKHPNIINDLCVFNPYQKLQNLIMPENRIQSLEPILYINAPLLWRIDFSQNNIVDMRAFRKMHCQKLVMFRISQNHISSLGQFQTCYCPQLMQISIKGSKKLSCINQLAKLQSITFKQIYAWESPIICTKKLRSIFEKRFEDLNLSL